MNIVLFTSDDPIYMPRYLEPVFKHRHGSIEEVILTPNDQSLVEDVKRRYAMFGPQAFIRFGLKYMSGKIKDALENSPFPLSPNEYYSVQTLAKQYDIPIRTVSDVNSDSFIHELQEKNPDLFLSIACGQILGEELLSLPPKGCINIHGSLLPKYRGVATSFWVLYHNEPESGVTAHYMTPELDAGEIIEQRRYEIEESDSMHDVYHKLIETGAALALDVLEDVEENEITTSPNEIDKGSYFSYPTAEERNEFLRRGNRFI